MFIVLVIKKEKILNDGKNDGVLLGFYDGVVFRIILQKNKAGISARWVQRCWQTESWC
jgi:hypothetical protein